MFKYVFLFSSLLFSCKMKKLDTSKVKEQMKNYTIKQVHHNDLSNEIEVLGQKLENRIAKNVNCEMDSIQFIDLNHVQNIFTGKSKEIIEAYQFSFKNKQTLTRNIQQLSDSTFLYTFPIEVHSVRFNKCHQHLGLKIFSTLEIIRNMDKK